MKQQVVVEIRNIAWKSILVTPEEFTDLVEILGNKVAFDSRYLGNGISVLVESGCVSLNCTSEVPRIVTAEELASEEAAIAEKKLAEEAAQALIEATTT